jgi:translocation and assembly module TamA
MLKSVPRVRTTGHAGNRATAPLLAGAALALVLGLAPIPTLAQSAQEPVPPEQGAASQDTAASPAQSELEAAPAPPPGAELPAVEPIITESEFEEAVPALDPAEDAELLGPLESIEEFERRLAAEETDAQPQEGQEPPAGDPALADQDQAEPIGDAPIRDAELATPLPPLSEFEVEAVEFTEEAGSEELTEIEYEIVVNGLEAADEEAEISLSAMFEDLSALHEGDGEAANVAQVAARLGEDSELIERILASEGWFEAQVTTRMDRSGMPNGQPLSAVIDVLPGTRYTFAEINIDAPPVEPTNLISDNLALQVGEPIIAARVQGAEAQVAVTLPQTGYPFGTVGQRDILLDQETGDGVYTLPVAPGPRSVFGDIRTTGNLAFDAEHVEVLARFERGELYDSRMVDDLRQALVATGLFNTISVVPEQTGQPAAEVPGTEYANLLVEQDAGPPRTIAGSAGYGTGQGMRVEGSWTHRNLFPPEGALIVRGVAGTQEQGAGVTFRRSNAGRRDRTFSLTAEALHSDYDAFEAYTGRLAATIAYDSTPIWQKPLTYAYGVQLIGTNEQDYNFDLGRLERRTFFIGGLTGQVGVDTTDDLLNPTEGFRVTALVEPEGSVEDGFRPYVRARLDGSAYLHVSDPLVLAGRVRFGTIQGVERFELAPSRRFYAGGGGSVRGFGFQELGPKVEVPNPDYPEPDEIDPEDDPEDLPDPTILRPIGGRSVVEAAAEVRYRFGNFGVVGFVDAGQVYEETYPTFDDIRFGAGIGGRYYTNFGPLRFDVATPIGRRRGESWITVYVSIGQAF